MPLQDLTPQLRTRLNKMERAVGWFVFLATALLLFGFGYYIYHTAERKGWFLDDMPAITTQGYQAPPLDGIWATAPYFHNGSVPTLQQVLKSDSRPAFFTRSFRTGEDDYDSVRVGWKYAELKGLPNIHLHPHESRKYYDTRQPGRSNRGHTYGDHLSEAERTAVVEYLKTL